VFISLVRRFLWRRADALQSRDVARLGRMRGLYSGSEEWTPEARTGARRFPSLTGPTGDRGAGARQTCPTSRLRPRTAFTMTPLPEGGDAIQAAPNGS